MAGLSDTDIKLDDDFMLTQAANGDAPIATGFDCVMQEIRLEAMTQAGDLFFDSDWGWSLFDFIQSENDELTTIEITHRIKSKLEKREVIDPISIALTVSFANSRLTAYATFRFLNDDTVRGLSITINSSSVEVIINDRQ